MKVLGFYVLKKKYKFQSDYYILHRRSGESTIIDEIFEVSSFLEFQKIRRRNRKWEYYCMLKAINWKSSTLVEIYFEWNNRKGIATGQRRYDKVRLMVFFEDDELIIIVYEDELDYRIRNYFDIGFVRNREDADLKKQLKTLTTTLTTHSIENYETK